MKELLDELVRQSWANGRLNIKLNDVDKLKAAILKMFDASEENCRLMQERLQRLIDGSKKKEVDTTPIFTGKVCRLYDSTTTNTDCFIAFDNPGREYIQRFIGQRVEVIIRKPKTKWNKKMNALEMLLRKISSSAYVSGLNDTEHHEDEDKTKQAILRMFEEKDELLKNVNSLFNPCGHTGFESCVCNVCGYPEPVKRIAKLNQKIAELELEVSYMDDLTRSKMEAEQKWVELEAQVKKLQEKPLE